MKGSEGQSLNLNENKGKRLQNNPEGKTIKTKEATSTGCC